MTTWTLSTWTDAARLAAAVDPRAVPAEAHGKPPRDWFVWLRDEGEPVDAVMFLAHAMPRYECIVWATRSLVEAGGIDRTDPGFVAALRWIDNPSDKLRRTAGDHAETADEDAPSTVLCQAVYLSGGSLAPEDLPAVQKLKAGLDAAGVKTWFDVERLESGDDYDRKIQKNIGRCAYFIPIVSANTERRLEGYFRREWSYAIDRARNIADGAVFILPVCVDDIDEGNAQVPDKFKMAHFTKLLGGEATPAFADRLKLLFTGRA